MLPSPMQAEIISIGTELLLGEIVDTNAQYLGARLPALGIDLYYISKVGDNLERLTEVIQRAVGRSDVVIATGGLGPTEDDVTREAIARALRNDPDLKPRTLWAMLADDPPLGWTFCDNRLGKYAEGPRGQMSYGRFSRVSKEERDKLN